MVRLLSPSRTNDVRFSDETEGSSATSPSECCFLAKPTDQKGMAIRAVETQHIERSLALGGVDHLANSEDWRAVRNTQKASGMGIGGCGIDFFVRVCNFQSVIVFQDGKKGDTVQRRLRQADKVLGGQVAGLDRKRFI